MNWVVAGALAKQLLPNIEINAYVSSVGDIFCEKPYQALDFSQTESNDVRCPDTETAEKDDCKNQRRSKKRRKHNRRNHHLCD